MSVSYKGISWTASKKRYDIVLLIAIIVSFGLFTGVQIAIDPATTAETILIRGSAFIATALLHVILIIGPLARLDTRFLPVLYNRRHLGVAMAFFSFIHGALMTLQYHGFGNENPLLSLFTAYAGIGNGVHAVPFEVLGVVALVVIMIMAVTSHDFWLNLLGASTWKLLHMLVYLAYGLIVAHVALGLMQDQTTLLIPALLALGMVTILTLHLMAWRQERSFDQQDGTAQDDGFVAICKEADIEEGEGRPIIVNGERLAVFKNNGAIQAIHGVCRHQGGPLGEGKLLDGCVTCPWHWWQYQPEDGCSPAPFTEVVATYPVDVRDGIVHVKAEANALCTPPALQQENTDAE